MHDRIIAAITEKGSLCSADLDIPKKVGWYWSETKLFRAALEHMYFTGELAVHHKSGAIKYYDGQRVILTSGELAEALSFLPEKKREIIYLYFFGRYTQQEIGEMYGRCRSTAWHHIHSALQILHEEMEVLYREES